jgi:hypothetical protein
LVTLHSKVDNSVTTAGRRSVNLTQHSRYRASALPGARCCPSNVPRCFFNRAKASFSPTRMFRKDLSSHISTLGDRLQLLDEVPLPQQRLHLLPCRPQDLRSGFRSRPPDASRMAKRARTVRHPRLPDRPNHGFRVQHPSQMGPGFAAAKAVLDHRVTHHQGYRVAPVHPLCTPSDKAVTPSFRTHRFPLLAATPNDEGQEESFPRFLWITLRESFWQCGFSLVFCRFPCIA